ncbi:MAG TPA: hypothetical protein VIL36_01935 [Acidimicrobiales bacterium]
MERRTFIVGAAALPSIASIDGLDSIAPTDPPARVGATEIAQIRDAAAAVKRGDLRWGGGFGFDAALVETRRARDLLDARCPAHLRPQLFVAVGWLAANTGFMAFDLERFRDASRLWTVASACAHEAGDHSLLARVLGSMARQATWLDHPDDAITLLDQALAAEAHLVPTELAMLWALKARAVAKTGDEAATARAVGLADQWFAARNLDDAAERPWIAHYSHAHHWGDTGVAWADVAVASNGDNTHAVMEAGGRHQAAAEGHGIDAARSHALSLIALSDLDTRVGDLDRAVRTGHQAVEAAEQVSSHRVRSGLVALQSAAGRHVARNDVAELRDRITAALVAA